MSLMQTVAATCPRCGTEAECELVSSINADRRPDLREDVLAGRLQAVTCANCGEVFRVAPMMSYVDFDRGQWIMVHPPAALPEWRNLEVTARASFDRLFGAAAPSGAREVGLRMAPRITFGWPALREKLLAVEYGLEDIDLELVKMAVMRDVPNMPFGDDLDLRLDGRAPDGAEQGTAPDAPAEGGLTFAWTARDTSAVVARVTVPRGLYDIVVGDTETWAALRTEVAAGAFVDLNRLLVT